MAIKGKGRTKARQPVRAPKRGPVPVPVPFFRRRSVQVVAAFLVGSLVFWGGIWLTNGLRAQDTSERDREQELLQRRTGAAWENLVATSARATPSGWQPPSAPNSRCRSVGRLRTSSWWQVGLASPLCGPCWNKSTESGSQLVQRHASTCSMARGCPGTFMTTGTSLSSRVSPGSTTHRSSPKIARTRALED
jgi:hypothetical protein